MKVAEIKKEIEKAYESLKKLGQDKESRQIYESRLKGIRDWVSSMDENFHEGRIEGEQIGIKKGEKKKALDVAKSLVKTDFSAEVIAKLTGLSVEEVKNLKTFNKTSAG